MLLDIGREGHRFYEFVLSLLITSLVMLVCLGIMIMYIGNIRYNRERGRAGWRTRLKQCVTCQCRLLRPCCRRRRQQQAEISRRSSSYISVPMSSTGAPIATLDRSASRETNLDAVSEVDFEPLCCWCQWPDSNSADVTNMEAVEADVEASRVRVASARAKLVKITSCLDEMDDMLKRNPRDASLQEEILRARSDLQLIRREREEAEAQEELALASKHHAQMSLDRAEEKTERQIFKRVTFWQNLATYLLYFVCLMNVFITAFGLYGSIVLPGRTLIVRASTTASSTTASHTTVE